MSDGSGREPADGAAPARTDGAALDPDLEEELVLADIVSHVLDRGAVITGEVTISVAGIDLVELGLHLYLSSTETADRAGLTAFPGGSGRLRSGAGGSPVRPGEPDGPDGDGS